MYQETSYTDEWARLEMALNQDVGQREGDTVRLCAAEQAIASSVLSSLETAQLADRAEAEAAGLSFDEENWLPSNEVEAAIREAHRPQRRFVNGLNGLRAMCKDVTEDLVEFTPPLHPHQKEVITETTAYLESIDPFAEDAEGAYHDIAGGGGKSRSIAMLTAGFKRQEDPEDPNKVLIIASDNAVLYELCGKDGQSGLGQYAPHLDVGRVNADYKEGDKPVVVSTRESVRRAIVKDPEFLEKFDLVLSDESHQLTGVKTQEALQGRRRPIIGFTGTIGRVAEVLPEQLVKYNSRELTESGQLAPIQHWVVKTKEVIYEETARGHYSEAELRHLSLLEGRQLIAGDIALAFFRDNRNGVLSCNTVEEAVKLAQVLDGTAVAMEDGHQREINVVPVIGTAKDNQQVVRALDQGEIQAITIVNIDTGWDAPGASFLINLRKTSSEVRAGQRKARVVRKHYDAAGNEVTAQVVDLVDTIYRKRRVAEDSTDIRRGRQILAATLMREEIYIPGQVIASPDSEGNRRDLSVEQFPPHLQWAVTMASGVPYREIEVFGAGLVREPAPGDKLTPIEAARGLGVSLSRLATALAVVSASNRGYIDEKLMEKLEEHFIKHDEPISV